MIDINNLIKLEKDYDIFVLRGFDNNSLSEIESFEMIHPNQFIENRNDMIMKYLSKERRIILYEEFLYFFDVFKSLDNKLLIIENPIFQNFVPLLFENLYHKLPKSEYEYIETEDSQFDVNLSLMYGCVEKSESGNLFVIYNDSVLDYRGIDKFYIYQHDLQSDDWESVILEDDQQVFHIENEISYINLVEYLQEGKSVQLFEDNSMFKQLNIVKQLSLLSDMYNGKLEIGTHENVEHKVIDRKLYLPYLNRYFNSNSFKEIECYSMMHLLRGTKKVKKVSQVEMIDDIVKQAENAMNQKQFRDVFITAPTGSGKSAIFQIPAMYIADKYGFMTIVISPLIGLMNDQVENLERSSYKKARTINSDISPIQKNEIKDEIANGDVNILYISPETLIARSMISDLIGDRRIGLFIIDEAHIVTTWGKQFRPDYWYLGDYIEKLRKDMFFPIATFTATAIYEGVENMYRETKDSLNLADPITYLGKVRRDDIVIQVTEEKNPIEELEKYKFIQVLDEIKRAILNGEKILIYFPTVKLINRFYDYCKMDRNLHKYVARYHGQMRSEDKQSNYLSFKNGERFAMLATKAFGMGININDIKNVMHYAPTGNVCDYLQEIGRAARDKDMIGLAIYKYTKRDFKHINRLHGLSTITHYHLVAVIQKILQMYNETSRNGKKSRRLLLDTESFAHIFENDYSSGDDVLNKVKTALLLIQKDFILKKSYSPIYVRPISMFRNSFFKVDQKTVDELARRYGEKILKEVDSIEGVYDIEIASIWEEDFSELSFPQFKFFLYSKSSDLDFEYKKSMIPVLRIIYEFDELNKYRIEQLLVVIQELLVSLFREKKYFTIEEIAAEFIKLYKVKIEKYTLITFIENFISVLGYFNSQKKNNIHTSNVVKREYANVNKYKFVSDGTDFVRWLNRKLKFLENNDNEVFIELSDKDKIKEIHMFLGLIELLSLVSFSIEGGKNSQMYIYVAETKSLENVLYRSNRYENILLKNVKKRHKLSVIMLSYLYGSDFTSDEIWDIIEDYFLGKIPEKVKKEYEEKYQEYLI